MTRRSCRPRCRLVPTGSSDAAADHMMSIPCACHFFPRGARSQPSKEQSTLGQSASASRRAVQLVSSRDDHWMSPSSRCRPHLNHVWTIMNRPQAGPLGAQVSWNSGFAMAHSFRVRNPGNSCSGKSDWSHSRRKVRYVLGTGDCNSLLPEPPWLLMTAISSWSSSSGPSCTGL